MITSPKYSISCNFLFCTVLGHINLDLSKLEDRIQLNQTANLNCTVFSSSDATIAWERNGVTLVDGMNRTSIEPSQEMETGGTYFFSVLKISDITREDDGIYKCLAFDRAGNMTDSADFTIFIQGKTESIFFFNINFLTPFPFFD